MREKYKKPQINADERRFVNLNIQRFSEFYPANGLIKSPQSTQSFAIPANKHETAPPSRRGTRMTRIFTDQRASASTVAPVDVAHTYGSCHTWRSVFYRIPSVFICVHLRLIFVSAYNYQNHSCLNLLENKPQIIIPRFTPLEGVSTAHALKCMLVALVLPGTAVGEVSRNGIVPEYHIDGDARYSNWNENNKTIYGMTVINLKR